MQLTEEKRYYYYTKIEASNNYQKSLFDITKKLLVNQQAATLPTHETNFELANRFGKFFDDKIEILGRSFRIDANRDVEIASVKRNNLIYDIYIKPKGKKSRWRNQKNDLPQGSVLSPVLFNVYTNDESIHNETRSFIYADDLCIAT